MPASTCTMMRSALDREHLAAPDLSVGPHDLDELVVADPFGVLGDEQRPGDA